MLEKPLPNIIAHCPLCKRLIIGVPKVLPMLVLQTGVHTMLVLSHSPLVKLAAFASLKLVGSVISKAYTPVPPAPKPLTSQVCQAPP